MKKTDVKKYATHFTTESARTIPIPDQLIQDLKDYELQQKISKNKSLSTISMTGFLLYNLGIYRKFRIYGPQFHTLVTVHGACPLGRDGFL